MSNVPPVNPFEAPTATGIHASTSLGDEKTAMLLKQTRPWTMVIGILMLIGSVLMCVVGVFMMVALPMAAAAGPGGPPAWFGPVFGIFYIIMGIIYLVPGIMLMKYSSRIATFLAAPTTDHLNDALGIQKSFWKFVGIGILVLIGLYILAIIVAVLFGIASGV